ncbi:MAG: hypothetical protein KZQ58_01900, partial [gamma proteobacterium symbiont of Bathyaustriella thionipta]|nr:hypothetical protein [gamma proteobacterium symbiont of Bathyaustriella thionipta]
MDSLQTQAPAALNLRSFFILALLLGAAAIVGGQLSGYRLLSVIAPIAIMLLYVALGYFRGSAEPIRDQF